MKSITTCRLVFCAILMSAGSPCQAQQEAVLTPDAAVRQALDNNPRITALRYSRTASRYAVAGAGALVNPELAYTPPVTDGGSDEEFILRQPLEVNGTRRSRQQAASRNAEAERAAAVAEVLGLVAVTKTAYYNLALARENLALARFVEGSATEFHDAMQRQVELGSRPGIERTQTGLELSRARLEVAAAIAGEQAAEAALNALLAQPPSSPVPPLAPLTPASEPPVSEEVAESAAASRPEPEMERALADAARAEASMARAEGRPDIAPQLRAGEIGGGSDAFGIGIAITLPLIDHGSRRARIKGAQAEARSRMSRAQALEREIRAEVEQAQARVEEADTRIAAFETGLLDQARRLLEASRIGLTEGKTSVLAVLEAQRTYREVEADRIAALVDLALARVELERAAGAFPAEEALTPLEVRP